MNLPTGLLTHFTPMAHFYIPLKYEKPEVFPTFSGGIEIEQWSEMD